MINKQNKFQIYVIIVLIFIPLSCLPQKILTVFSHGIADTYKQAYAYAKSNQRYFINTPFVTFNYPDATNSFYRVNYNETSFGQENEIQRLNNVYKSTLIRYDDCNIILWGLSRGASNILIFAGLYQPHNIKALILESPYFTMGEVISNIMTRNNLGWLPLSYGQTIAEFIFKKYTRYGYTPAHYIQYISKNIPIFITCSKKDLLVPYTTSINVYKELVRLGHEDTYIFIADEGQHAAILQGSDGEKYECVINAFYKKYNLPYSAIHAKKGEFFLTLCQPQFD